jgi:DNA-binding response OmpR family regulator
MIDLHHNFQKGKHMEKKRILIVDDEEDLCEILSFNLKKAGYETEVAYSAEDAYSKLKNNFDLLLLDVMMGAISGFKLAELVREDYSTEIPIIFITAKDRENDKLHGFDLGADDYISKPFSVKEVIARVNAVLSRYSAKKEIVQKKRTGSKLLIYNSLTIDCEFKKATIAKSEIKLTRKEFEILQMLAEEPGKIFSRSDILTRVWNDDSYVLERTVDVHIARLRKKMGSLGHYIVNRSGYGYCFSSDEN